MQIKSMFERDIDRDINGVVKVAQEEEASVKQELEEYVVTRELAGHFANFYDAYERALDRPTEKIGVWISGFFGSGKSHFLKMLSYLLTNQRVAGRQAVDYFDGKFEDMMVEAKVRRCAAVPTQSILFNVDNKAVGAKDKDVLKRTFARVFYDALGFYGEDLKLARLEKFIDERGKTEQFRTAFEGINGESWLTTRAEYDFFSDDVIAALEQSGVMSADEATRWVDGTEGANISLELLTDQIRDYANAQAGANGGDFRLLFMVDEIGQFLAGDVNLMLNLQTFVEELGTKCAGRVWVMVTSQEDIDSVVKVVGSDFSKIQGRFNTRLSLTSSSADEVIKRRILAKTPDAANLLRAQYGQTASILKNLYTFEKSTGDLIGYDSAEDFAATFPFAGYQFKIMQNVMSEIRKHGSSGKHLSSGERSMLSGFQEAAQRVEDKDENALVPFWMFYDTLQTFLEGHIRRVIDRAATAAEHGDQGLEPMDVNVLKLLFMLRWVNDIKTTVDNVVTLMTDDVRADRMALREQVQASLDRLVRQNYVGLNGSIYTFLTDDEQEVARLIAREEVDAAAITKKVKEIFFGNVFTEAKLRVGENDFPIEEWVDETRCNQASGLTLRVMTTLSDTEKTNRTSLTLRSANGPEAIIVLSDEFDYYDTLLEAERIESYCRKVNIGQLNKQMQDIIRGKQQQTTELSRRATALIEDAVRHGAFFANGEEMHPANTTSPKKLIAECLERLVAGEYPKLSLIDTNYHSDTELREILDGKKVAFADKQPNARAIADVESFLNLRAGQHLPVTMGELLGRYKEKPYGWREVDIAVVVAELLSQNRARALYAGASVDLKNPKLLDYLRKRTEAEKLTVERRQHVDDRTRARAREAVVEFVGADEAIYVPGEEDALARRAHELLSERRDELQHLLDVDYAHSRYPGRETVEAAIKLANKLIAVGTDPSDLLSAIASAYEDLLDAAEETGFFNNMRALWDSAAKLKADLEPDHEYLEADDTATTHLATIRNILKDDRPYRRVKDLGTPVQELRCAHSAMLKAKQTEMLERVKTMFEDINAYAQQNDVSLSAIGQREAQRKDAVHSAATLTKLDAIKSSLDTDQSTLYAQIDREVERKKASRLVNTPATNTPAASTTAPAPEPPRKVVRKVERTLVFKPKRLSSAQEVDDYLADARAKLLAQLEDADAIQIN